MFIDVEREGIGGGFSLYFYHGDGMPTHLMYGEKMRHIVVRKRHKERINPK